MKAVILTWIGVLIAGHVIGQEITYPLESASESLIVNIQVGHTVLIVRGSKNNSIRIKSLHEVSNTTSRADGLRPLLPLPDNTGLGLNISEDGDQVDIIKPDRRMKGEYEIFVPDHANVHITEIDWGGSDFLLSNLLGTVSVKSTSSDITIGRVTGSIRAETTSGTIEVKIPPPSADSSNTYRFSSVSGALNIDLTGNGSFDLDLSTISGYISTNFEIKNEIIYKGSVLKRIGRLKNVKMNLNGGGSQIEASTVSGPLKITEEE